MQVYTKKIVCKKPTEILSVRKNQTLSDQKSSFFRDVQLSRNLQQNESSGAASPKEQKMNFTTIYVIAGLISWQPFIRQNDKGLEALVEIIFLCCLVDTGESGWTGTVVI